MLAGSMGALGLNCSGWQVAVGASTPAVWRAATGMAIRNLWDYTTNNTSLGMGQQSHKITALLWMQWAIPFRGILRKISAGAY